jgi:hypothetical protein
MECEPPANGVKQKSLTAPTDAVGPASGHPMAGSPTKTNSDPQEGEREHDAEHDDERALAAAFGRGSGLRWRGARLVWYSRHDTPPKTCPRSGYSRRELPERKNWTTSQIAYATER